MRAINPCQQVREGLREYLDTAGPPGQRDATDQHLASCPSCRAFAEEMRTTSQLLSTLPRAAMPAEMKASLLDAFRRGPAA